MSLEPTSEIDRLAPVIVNRPLLFDDTSDRWPDMNPHPRVQHNARRFADRLGSRDHLKRKFCPSPVSLPRGKLFQHQHLVQCRSTNAVAKVLVEAKAIAAKAADQCIMTLQLINLLSRFPV